MLTRSIRPSTPAQPLPAERRGNVATTTQAGAPALQERLAAAIRAEVEKSLQGDRQLGEQVAQVLAARRFDNDTRAQIVRLIGARAHQLVPGAAKRILNEWTQTTLASHRARTSHADAGATRRELQPASSVPRTPAASAAPRSKEQSSALRQNTNTANSHGKLDYRHLTDEQIFDL